MAKKAKRTKLKEGEQPKTKISQKLLNKGKQICILAGPRSWTIENWIMDVREELPKGTEVDWLFQGGRVFVLATGDIEKVRQVIDETKEELNKVYLASQEKDAHKFDLLFSWS